MKFFSESGYGPIRGMFSIDHLIFSLTGIIAIFMLVFLTHKKNKEQIDKYIKYIFIIVVVLEILKIIWNFVYRTNIELNNWVPLYFCSLFIYASGMYSYGKGIIKKIGFLWMTYGQIIGGLVFILFPSSSVGIQPLFHVLTFHSWIYHVLTAYVGIILIFKNLDSFKSHDIKLYTITILSVELFVYIFNVIFDSNLMFINSPGVVEPLKYVQNIFGAFYPLIIGISQCIGSFLISFGIIKFFKKIQSVKI